MPKTKKAENGSHEEKSLATTQHLDEKTMSDAPQVSHYSDFGATAPIVNPRNQGIQVDPGQLSDEPEVYKAISPLYTVASESPTVGGRNPSQSNLEVAPSSKPAAKIFGIRRNMFWVLAVLILVIIGAAVGGGVGGGLARESQSQRARTTVVITIPRLKARTGVFS